jgi:hypothetical protein
MNALTHCKAMEAFCRQRAKIENEAAGFWLNEAQLWRDRLAALAAKANPVARSSREAVTRTRRVAS